MNALGALVAVLAIGWAAYHPNGEAPSPRPAQPPPGCTITQRSDGPVDPQLLDMQRKLAEALCRDLDNGSGITESDAPETGDVFEDA